MIKRFAVAAVLALSLAGCAQFQALNDLTIAAQSTTVSPKAIFIAASAFDAIEITATNYLDQCPRATASGFCYGADRVRAAVIPAVRSGIIVRRKIVAAARAAGDNPVAVVPDWSSLKSITSTIKDVLAQYGVPVGVQ